MQNNGALTKMVESSMILPQYNIARQKTILTDNDKRNLNEKAILIYLHIQKEKVEFEDTIEEEYIEKALMFGFLMVSIFIFLFAIAA